MQTLSNSIDIVVVETKTGVDRFSTILFVCLLLSILFFVFVFVVFLVVVYFVFFLLYTFALSYTSHVLPIFFAYCRYEILSNTLSLMFHAPTSRFLKQILDLTSSEQQYNEPLAREDSVHRN